VLAQRLTPVLGQQIVVDNRAGAGGNIGAELAARAPADGHTIMLVTNTHAINMTLYARPGYDLLKDFAPITPVTTSPMVLIVYPGVPAKTLKELIALARASPGKYNYGMGGSGSSAHVITELLKSMTGINVVMVAYKGVAQATTDLIAGQIHLMFNSSATAVPHMQAGRVRGIALSSMQRSPLVPGVPTIAESGVPGFDASIWQGVMSPASVPRGIVARLHRDITGVLSAQETRDAFTAAGVEAISSTQEQFATYIGVEIAKWSKVVKAAGAKQE
jgi:tripartite-type tricarboxylate transporter receptor subunit TctC